VFVALVDDFITATKEEDDDSEPTGALPLIRRLERVMRPFIEEASSEACPDGQIWAEVQYQLIHSETFQDINHHAILELDDAIASIFNTLLTSFTSRNQVMTWAADSVTVLPRQPDQFAILLDDASS